MSAWLFRASCEGAASLCASFAVGVCHVATADRLGPIPPAAPRSVGLPRTITSLDRSPSAAVGVGHDRASSANAGRVAAPSDGERLTRVVTPASGVGQRVIASVRVVPDV